MKEVIEKAFKTGEVGNPDVNEAVEATIADLNIGRLRVCEKTDQGWQVNEWVKKAILLFFRIRGMKVMELGADFSYFDKIPLKKWSGKEGVRVVPHALARYGSFIEGGAILMPSYVNIGAYVGAGTMIDTWATVGSCAQIGQNVHVSGGVGIGGVLEPVQAKPVIIEDHAFLGSRSIIVEGVRVSEGAVLGSGLILTSSTRIIDVTGAEPKTYRGEVPPNSVCVLGTTPKNFPAGEYGIPCALIIGQRKESTDRKTSLTAVLREFNIS